MFPTRRLLLLFSDTPRRPLITESQRAEGLNTQITSIDYGTLTIGWDIYQALLFPLIIGNPAQKPTSGKV
jgi:hypothetical protein